jgi:leucyl-tRNA synthetase
MPQWAGSSWYYLRYCDADNKDALASKEALNYWGPVDWYNGGMEHTTLHLLYSRFWHKFLYDIGIVPTKEPYAKRTSHGMILGENGEKMSKSRGNVVNPDDIISEFGADTLRLYEMFIGDFEKSAPWSVSSVKGCKRFLERVFSLSEMVTDESGYSKELEASFHRTIKKVSNDIENLKFNTAIAALMALLNEIYDKGSVTHDEFKTYLLLLSPFAPHMADELLEICGYGVMAEESRWPEYSEDKLKEAVIEIPVQICGKLKTRITVEAEMTEEQVLDIALEDEKIKELTLGKEIIKKIYVKGKLLNIVVR